MKSMRNMTLCNIAAACGGELYGIEPCETEQVQPKEATCIVIDSRKLEQGGVFIATRGEKVDGHSFIPDVAKKGALGVVCEQKPENVNIPCIVVKDSFQALKDIAEFYRKQLSITVVGITGSVGKTSTKEFIAAVLSQKYAVLKTEGNFNNEVGLPLTVLSIGAEHQIAVLEMGISDFGEMHRLSKIARPDICVITNIGQCHLENLGTREGILKAKSEIFDFMNPDGFVYVNGDDDLLAEIEYHGKNEPIHYGMHTANEIYASQVSSRGLLGSCAVFHANLKTFPVEIGLPGKHMVYNALVAAGVGMQLGLVTDEIRAGISQAKALGGRSNVISLSKYTLIDDCYNANPVSMCAALDLLSTALTRKVAILGDMFELGEKEADFHSQVGAYAIEKEIDVLICVGELCAHMYHQAKQHSQAASASPKTEVHHFATCDEMLKKLPSILQTGDAVLVKASHGMHFEKVVVAITQGLCS